MKAAFLGLISVSFCLVSCDWMPGKPNPATIWKPPSAMTDFASLYDLHCLACHSRGETLGAANPMNNALYLAILPRDVLRKTIEEGIPGTTMPGFGEGHGGELTEEQVNSLIEGIYRLAPPAANAASPPTEQAEQSAATQPPYAGPLGDAKRGAQVFATFCASCHGEQGKGGKNGPVTDPNYLSLVTDQYLRTITIVGRQDLGTPDYRNYVSGRPMTPEEINDVVAWLASQRSEL
jgi:mono/diheme cytochrome c family protein